MGASVTWMGKNHEQMKLQRSGLIKSQIFGLTLKTESVVYFLEK